METIYKKKYNKYLEKYDKLKYQIETLNAQKGGQLTENDILLNIISVGFEFESAGMSPLIKVQDTTVSDEGVYNNASYETVLNKSNLRDGHILETGADKSYEFKVVNDYGGSIFANGSLNTSDNYNIRDIEHSTANKLIFPEIDSVVRKFSNTEFITTFYKITRSKNAILNKFYAACNIISRYINGLHRTMPARFGNSTTDKLLGIYKMDGSTESFKLYVKAMQDKNSKLTYITSRESSTIKFNPQMTIGVKLSKSIHVIKYLLECDIPEVLQHVPSANEITHTQKHKSIYDRYITFVEMMDVGLKYVALYKIYLVFNEPIITNKSAACVALFKICCDKYAEIGDIMKNIPETGAEKDIMLKHNDIEYKCNSNYIFYMFIGHLCNDSNINSDDIVKHLPNVAQYAILQDSESFEELHSWITFTIQHYIAYKKYATKINAGGNLSGTYFKNYIAAFVRHPLKDVCPLDIANKHIFDSFAKMCKNYCVLCNSMSDNYFMLDYFDILLNNTDIGQILKTDTAPPSFSTLLPYENKIVLIELRSFAQQYKLFDRTVQFNQNLSIDKINELGALYVPENVIDSIDPIHYGSLPAPLQPDLNIATNSHESLDDLLQVVADGSLTYEYDILNNVVSDESDKSDKSDGYERDDEPDSIDSGRQSKRVKTTHDSDEFIIGSSESNVPEFNF